MQCNCGGSMLERTSRGETYLRCRGCGRCHFPERIVSVSKRSEYDAQAHYGPGDIMFHDPELSVGQVMVNRLNEWLGLEPVHIRRPVYFICNSLPQVNALEPEEGEYWHILEEEGR